MKWERFFLRRSHTTFFWWGLPWVPLLLSYENRALWLDEKWYASYTCHPFTAFTCYVVLPSRKPVIWVLSYFSSRAVCRKILLSMLERRNEQRELLQSGSRCWSVGKERRESLDNRWYHCPFHRNLQCEEKGKEKRRTVCRPVMLAWVIIRTYLW
jgi:hypothetical protein